MATETFVEADGIAVRVSSPERVVFPATGWTKLDIVNHFIMSGEGALRGVYNRKRQENITKELLDIVGGVEALR